MNDIIVILFILSMIISSIILIIKQYDSWIYVIFLIIIASWLLSYPHVLSPYIIGIDSHYEYIIADSTLINGYWNATLERNIVNAALSITLFVPIISIVSEIPINYVLKYVLSIYPIISIPIIWNFNKKVFKFSNRESFMSLLLLIGTSSYMLISVYGRQEVGLFIMLMLLYTMILKKTSTNITILVILLTMTLIISHYSTAIFFIVTYFSSHIFLKLLKKNTDLKFLLLSFVLLIFWLFYVVYVSMMSITYTIQNIITSVVNWSTESTSYVVQQQLNPSFNDIFSTFNYYVNVCIILLLLFGTFYVTYNQIFVKKNSLIRCNKYVLFSFLSSLSLFFSLLPGVSLAYNAERIFISTLFLFNGFILVGLERFLNIAAHCCKKVNYIEESKLIKLKHITIVLASMLVLLHLLLQIGLPSQIVYGEVTSKYFGDIKEDMHYTLRDEVAATSWLKENINDNSLLFTDFYGRGRLPLESYARFSRSDFRDLRSVESIIISINNTYFYQQKFNLAKHNLIFKDDLENIININFFLKNKTNKIYTSDNTNIYYL